MILEYFVNFINANNLRKINKELKVNGLYQLPLTNGRTL